MKDLGWANSWRSDPPEVVQCQAAGHPTTDVDVGAPFRGMEHVVKCEVCQIVYRYDSSD